MYHAISAMLQPIYKEQTPTARALKTALAAFYCQTGELRNNMERVLPIWFDKRLQDVLRSDHWGEYTDAFSLATLYSLRF